MNSKECPKCKQCSRDSAASCRVCGYEFPTYPNDPTPAQSEPAKPCSHANRREVGVTREGAGTVLVDWCPDCGAQDYVPACPHCCQRDQVHELAFWTLVSEEDPNNTCTAVEYQCLRPGCDSSAFWL